MTAAVTPLEALRRLYEVARKVDASESGEFDNALQGELAVAESVLRVAAAAPVVPVAARPVVPDESHSDATQRAFELSAKARGYKLERDNLGRYRDTHILNAWNIMIDTVAQLAAGRHFTSGRLKLAEQALIKNGFSKVDDVWTAPSLEAQPAGEVVYQVQHAIGPDWTDVTKPVYDKWWRENKRVIHLTAMAQGDKHEPT